MNEKATTALIIFVLIAGAIFIVFRSLKKTEENMQTTNNQDAGSLSNNVQETSQSTMEQTQQATQSTQSSSQQKKYLATMKTTKGDIVIELNSNQTPKTVENFVTLANKKFYDNTIFHRVIKGFMIQGGDPQGNGTGGPGYKFDDEPFEGEYTRGIVAMANAGPNTNGSQFFVMHQYHALPHNYVIFGHVTKGIEIVDTIASDDVTISGSGEMSKPVNPTKVLSVTITEIK